MDTTTCPACGALAEVVWRAVLESTDGPIEHAKVLCVQRHWFLLPVGSLQASAHAPTRPAPQQESAEQSAHSHGRRAAPAGGRTRE
jgi:hypothetical protein